MTRPWTLLLAASVATLVAAETLLLVLATGVLTHGYNSPHLDAAALWIGFLPGALILDAWLVATVWTLVVPLADRISRSHLQVYWAAAVAAVALPLALTAARYDVYATFGDRFSLALASQFSKLGASAVAGQVLVDAPYTGAGIGLCLCVVIAVWELAGRWSQSAAWRPRIGSPPPARILAGATLALTVVGAAIVVSGSQDDGLRFGFDRTLSGQLLGRFVDAASDVDLDGAGSLRHPVDPSPFDPERYPYALDVPGNGIDENGVGGDHPLGAETADHPIDDGIAADVLPVRGGSRPHVLLIYLESFRADLLERRVAGREVTPFLDRLAREGGASPHAYVHAPWTLESRAQLFGGRLVNRAGDSTLVDDFHARGYTVAHFSGQDDSYGGSVEILGADRADAFYDARTDVERRTSRSSAPVNLQVSWKTVLGRVRGYLDTYDGAQPLFVYVNLVDTHYPYTHDEIDAILDVERVGRRDIRVDAAREVFETYANTAANVDRAAEEVVRSFRAAIGGADHAILVTSDHGQAFYEHGALGHGQYLGAEETQVPFIAWGIGGEWPEPIAPTDVRGLLRRNLGRDRGDDPRPRFVADPERRILQYASKLASPRFVAYRGIGDTLHYDFARDRLERWFPDGRSEIAHAAVVASVRPMIWRWEDAQRLGAQPARVVEPTATQVAAAD